MRFSVSLALALLGPPLTAPPAPSLSPDALIARHVQARGGAARLRQVRTVRFSGTLKTGGASIQMEILKKRPAFFRVTLRADDAVDGGGFDGTAWELRDGVPERVDGAAALNLKRAAEFDESFVDHKTKGNVVELAESRSIEGRDCPALRVTLADGLVREYFFDPSTFLVVADRKVSDSDGARLTLRQDYRQVSGVLIPFGAIERDMDSGTVQSEVRWDLIEVDVPLEDAAFAPPATP
jgi:hypothetical protein